MSGIRPRLWVTASALALTCQRAPKDADSETEVPVFCASTNCERGQVCMMQDLGCACDPAGDYCTRAYVPWHCEDIPPACERLDDEALGECLATELCGGGQAAYEAFDLECHGYASECAGPCDQQPCDTEGPIAGGCGEARDPASCAFRQDADEGRECAWYSAYPVAIVDGACTFGQPFGVCETTSLSDDGCFDEGVSIAIMPDGDTVLMNADGLCHGAANPFEPCETITDDQQLALCACALEQGSPV